MNDKQAIALILRVVKLLIEVKVLPRMDYDMQQAYAEELYKQVKQEGNINNG